MHLFSGESHLKSIGASDCRRRDCSLCNRLSRNERIIFLVAVILIVVNTKEFSRLITFRLPSCSSNICRSAHSIISSNSLHISTMGGWSQGCCAHARCKRLRAGNGRLNNSLGRSAFSHPRTLCMYKELLKCNQLVPDHRPAIAVNLLIVPRLTIISGAMYLRVPTQDIRNNHSMSVS
jgi:hypothetical protein